MHREDMVGTAAAAAVDWSLGDVVYLLYLGLVAVAWVVAPMLMVLVDR